MRLLLALAAVLLVTACSGEGDEPTSAPAPAVSSSAPRSSSPVPTPGAPDQSNGAGTAACAEVVAGINAFNAGDLDETVEHFEKALPLAEAQDDGSTAAGLLVDAVRYYAELPAEDYTDAAATSPEFARWKAVTLGQCVDGDGGTTTEAPGQEA